MIFFVTNSQPGHRQTLRSTLADTRSDSRETDNRNRTDTCQAMPTDRSPHISLTTPDFYGTRYSRKHQVNGTGCPLTVALGERRVNMTRSRLQSAKMKRIESVQFLCPSRSSVRTFTRLQRSLVCKNEENRIRPAGNAAIQLLFTTVSNDWITRKERSGRHGARGLLDLLYDASKAPKSKNTSASS